MLKIAIVGCGKFADEHVKEIVKLKNVRIAAACDTEQLMAEQLADRYGISRTFLSADEMLAQVKPDVVHITTPPVNHYALAKKCLEAGCHVYVEKPFTLHFQETEALIVLAEKRNLKITVGHNYQFNPAAERMRRIVRSGFLGEGRPVHIESMYCYGWLNSDYGKAVLNDPYHWVRHLPGQLLHNVISHGVARIAEFIHDENPEVQVIGYQSRLLREIENETSLVDELRVIIRDDGLSAFFTFSSDIQPGLNEMRIYGTKNSLMINDTYQSVIKIRNKTYKSYLQWLIPNYQFHKQYVSNFYHTLRNCLNYNYHFNYGLKNLIEAFYSAVIYNNEPPISYKEIRLTAKIMETIFNKLSSKPSLEEQL